MQGKRAGRLQKIAYDATPINAERPDLEARIGWLLAMSRLHHRDDSLRDGRSFTGAMARAGAPVSRSLVSRWESGEIPISYDALLAYEQILDTDPGQLTSVVAYLRATIPGVRDKLIRPRFDPASAEFSARLDFLIESAEEGKASPAEWQDLGWHLSLVPLAHLRAATWERLAHTLVGMIPRGVGVGFRELSTSMMNLSRVPRAQAHLLAAIDEYLHTPFVQIVNNPIGELDLFDSREATRLIFEMLEDPLDADAFRVAVWTATQKLRRGQFTPAEQARLEVFVLARWRADPQSAVDTLAELIAALPAGVQGMLAAAAAQIGRKRLGYVLEHGETVAAGRAGELARSLADGTRRTVGRVSGANSTYAEDNMLPRLIREALFHRSSECRYHAAWLLGASPFREALDNQLLDLLQVQLPVTFRESLARLARYLHTERQRLQLHQLIDDPHDVIAISAARALGHLPRTTATDAVLRNALAAQAGARRTPVAGALLYGLGMTGSPALAQLAHATGRSWQRDAAGWWLHAGSGVFADPGSRKNDAAYRRNLQRSQLHSLSRHVTTNSFGESPS
ncbi:MAG: hypothetical protein JWR35_2497 [Marmoricola sp.]|nr:hypothetical protein [Marmoricola sp.]